MLVLLLLLILVLSISVSIRGGRTTKNYNSIKSDIIAELSQYPTRRVADFLKLNNLDKIIKKNKISNVSDFFNTQNISKNTFYTAMQNELLNQNPGKVFTKTALKMSDTDLLESYNSGINLFK